MYIHLLLFAYTVFYMPRATSMECIQNSYIYSEEELEQEEIPKPSHLKLKELAISPALDTEPFQAVLHAIEQTTNCTEMLACITNSQLYLWAAPIIFRYLGTSNHTALIKATFINYVLQHALSLEKLAVITQQDRNELSVLYEYLNTWLDINDIVTYTTLKVEIFEKWIKRKGVHSRYNNEAMPIYHKEKKLVPLLLAARKGLYKFLLTIPYKHCVSTFPNFWSVQHITQYNHAKPEWYQSYYTTYSPLMHAISNESKTPAHILTAALLIHNGADIEQTVDHLTPLMKAAQSANLPMMELLIAHGADIRPKPDTGFSPLMHIVTHGSSNLIGYILDKMKQHPEDLNHAAKESSGMTPLHLAIHTGILNNIRLLLEAGADIHASARIDGYFKNCLEYAEYLKLQNNLSHIDWDAIIALLLQYNQPSTPK